MVNNEGSPFLVVPAFLALPFVLRALIRGWLGSAPAVRQAPERSGPSPTVPAEAWDALATHTVWRQVLLPLNVNYSCRFGRLLVRRRTVRWALLRVLKTQKTKRRERPLGDVHGVR